jgi:hypothetical protein
LIAGDVDLAEPGVVAPGPQRGRNGFTFLDIEIGDQDPGPFGGELLTDTFPETGCPAGDDRNEILETHGGFFGPPQEKRSGSRFQT